jgi:predicted small metal-binding protein
MQSLLHDYPGKTGADELEPVSLASVKCSDPAMDCSFEAKGTTEREIIRQLIDHMESEHNIPVLTAEAMYRFKKAIKNSDFSLQIHLPVTLGMV